MNRKQDIIHSSIRKYCRHIRRAHIEVLRYDRRLNKSYWDLPAIASICHDGYFQQLARGYSDTPAKEKWADVLNRIMTKLGGIGNKHKGCKNIIGRCAEQHAANKYIRQYNQNHIDKLHFTVAVRPRTMQVYPPCNNCKTIFPQLA